MRTERVYMYVGIQAVARGYIINKKKHRRNLPGFCPSCREGAPFLVGCYPSPFGRATTGPETCPTGPACCRSRRRTSPSRSETGSISKSH